MANSRKAFSLQEKVKLIEACKTKSQAQVAKEFSVARGTLNGFIKDKIKIMEWIQIFFHKICKSQHVKHGKTNVVRN